MKKFRRLFGLCFTSVLLVGGILLAQTGPGGVGNSSNNQLWLKSTTGLTLNGSNVSAWADQSGSGNTVTQATSSAQPLLVNNEMNGKPVVRFDGINDFLFNSDFALHLEANGHIYIVFKTGTTQNNTFMISFPEGLLGASGFDIGFSTTGMFSNVKSTALFTSTTSTLLTYNDDSPRISHAAFNGDRAVNEHQLYTNGTLSDQTGNSGPLLSNVVNQLFLGCFSNSFGAFAEFDVAEVIVFSSELKDIEKSLIENYLSACYNITISNDKYASSTHARDVAGIGREAGEVHSEAHSAGLILQENGSANANGDCLLGGHNVATNSVVSSNLPVGISRRWDREWLLDKSGTLDGANVKIGFDFGDAGFSEIPVTASEYRLLNHLYLWNLRGGDDRRHGNSRRPGGL